MLEFTVTALPGIADGQITLPQGERRVTPYLSYTRTSNWKVVNANTIMLIHLAFRYELQGIAVGKKIFKFVLTRVAKKFTRRRLSMLTALLSFSSIPCFWSFYMCRALASGGGPFVKVHQNDGR